ncbi:MAG: hypothetical protein QM698_04435 [Micropepsaceae bacterium]
MLRSLCLSAMLCVSIVANALGADESATRLPVEGRSHDETRYPASGSFRTQLDCHGITLSTQFQSVADQPLKLLVAAIGGEPVEAIEVERINGWLSTYDEVALIHVGCSAEAYWEFGFVGFKYRVRQAGIDTELINIGFGLNQRANITFLAKGTLE